MTMKTLTTLSLTLLLTAACQQKQSASSSNTTSAATPAASAAALTPEELGELGAQIHKHPDNANELLAHQGLTPETFEKSIRKVTENVDASKRYTSAYKRAGG